MLNAKGAVVFSISDICRILKERQDNEYDGNFGVSGRRGNGKSTLILKILARFKKEGFNQEKHQVYERDDVMNLLSKQQKSFCWDDEAINSGYKRDFQNKGQHELIKLVTNYRDNFNIYGSALPFFFSLDRDLRELIFMHIHIIERGLAVVFMQIQDQIHSLDPWDTKFNQKIEEQEMKRLAKNPIAKIRYHRFSTFAGYLAFNDVTPKQRKKYLEIKHRKRAKRFEGDESNPEVEKTNLASFLTEELLAGRLTKEAFQQMCVLKGKRITAVEDSVRNRLRNLRTGKTLGQLWKKVEEKKVEKKPKERTILANVPKF